MSKTLQLLAVIPLAGLVALAAPPTPERKPIYVQLFTRIDDHLNVDMSEDKVRRALAIAEALHASKPAAKASITLEFSGSAADVIESRSRGTGLIGLVKQAAEKGIIRIGYDGRNEPTPALRPQPNFRFAKTPADRWLARQQPLDWFLSEYKDPLYGEPDLSRSGSLKRVREIFGGVEWIGGVSLELGGDPELSHLIERMHLTVMFPGLPEGSAWPARNLHGYGGSVKGFGNSMAAVSGAAPEVFWQDGILRLSDTSGAPMRVLSGVDTPESVKKVLDGLDRTRPHIIRMQINPTDFYIKADALKTLPGGATVRYGYENPKVPYLPPPTWKPGAERDSAYQAQDALLRWFTEDFFVANGGSRFISPGELLAMAKSNRGADMPQDVLSALLDRLLAQWALIGTHPPTYAEANGHTLSLAETFQVLVDSLAERQKSGSTPAAVRVTGLHGPMDLTLDPGPSQGSVRVDEVLEACTRLRSELRDETWTEVPKAVVPTWIPVGNLRVNAAQFLNLMARAYRSPDRAKELPVTLCNLHSEYGLAYPYSRPRTETGATWTVRPAVLRAE